MKYSVGGRGFRHKGAIFRRCAAALARSSFPDGTLLPEDEQFIKALVAAHPARLRIEGLTGLRAVRAARLNGSFVAVRADGSTFDFDHAPAIRNLRPSDES